MDAPHHAAKFARMLRSLERLSPEADCELIVELCMLAGTHLVNAALHAQGFPDDIVHSDFLGLDPADPEHVLRPDWAKVRLRAGLEAALEDLARVEAYRPTHVRGPLADPAPATHALAWLRRIRDRAALA